MRGNNTTFFQGPVQKLEIRLLEQTLRWTLGVAAIGDDDIKLVFLVCQEFEAIADVCRDVGVLKANAHAWKVFLGESDDRFVDITENCGLDGGVLDNFAEDTAVTTADDENGFRVGVRVHGKMGYHFLVSAYCISQGQLLQI